MDTVKPLCMVTGYNWMQMLDISDMWSVLGNLGQETFYLELSWLKVRIKRKMGQWYGARERQLTTYIRIVLVCRNGSQCDSFLVYQWLITVLFNSIEISGLNCNMDVYKQLGRDVSVLLDQEQGILILFPFIYINLLLIEFDV